MTVRAKMFVQEITQTTYGGRVKLNAVCRGEDNKEWASATPSGTLELNIRNEVAFEAIGKPGTEVFVDISPVPTGLVAKEGMGD